MRCLDTRSVLLSSLLCNVFLCNATSAQTRLSIGQSVSYVIKANVFLSRTNVVLEDGKTYHLSASATDHWWDDYVKSNANGFTSSSSLLKDDGARAVMKATEGLRRKPDANWFCLIGELNPLPSLNNRIFEIGLSRTTTIPNGKGGVLHLWPNDVSTMYGNNRDHIRVTVTRVR